MPNIIINPNSGIIEFNTGSASGSAFDSSLQGASRLEFQNSGELNLTSLGTGVADKFTIDGSNGRLLTVNNTVTGSIFSVNDVAGLPIVEVFSDDRVVIGQYASDALVVSGSDVTFANLPTISGQTFITGFAEGDTLQTVTDRGATSTNAISVSNIVTSNEFVVGNQGKVNSSSTVGLQLQSTSTNKPIIFLTNVAGQTERMRIQGDGKVGIGTTVPSGVLDVGGDGADIFLHSNDYKIARIQPRGTSADLDKGLFSLFSTTTERVRIDSAGNSWFNGGSVGIGTDNPQSYLDVKTQIRVRDSNSDSTHVLLDSNASEGRLRLNNGSNWGLIARGAANNPYLGAYEGGNLNIVGFSTSDGANIDHILTQFDFANERVEIDQYTVGSNGSQNVFGKLSSFANSDTDNIFLGLKNGSYPNRGFAFRTVADGVNCDFTIYEHGLGSAEVFRITSEGRVGIGATNPTDILTINQSADSNGIRINGYDDHSSSFAKLFVKSNGHAELSQSTNGADGYLKISAENYLQLSAGTFVYTDDQFRIYDAGQLSLGNGADFFLKYDNSTDKLKIHSSSNDGITMDTAGKVGIGTNAPAVNLHVESSTSAQFKVGNGTQFVRLYADADEATILADGSVDMRFYVGGGEKMRLDTAGRLGIGSTSPQGKLDAGANTDQNIFLGRARFGSYVTDYLYLSHYDNATSTSYALKQSPAGSTAINAKASQNVSMSVNNSDIVFVKGSTSRVGIGTVLPSELLHVDGKTQLGDRGYSEGGLLIDYASLSETKGGAATLLGNAVYAGTTNNTFRRTKGDAGNYIRMTYNKGICFHTNVTGNTSDDYSIDNHEQMRIDLDGNVGIGTTDPATQLDVSGIATASALRAREGNINYNLITRNDAAYSLYVQASQSATQQQIASFRYGNGAAGQGTEVLSVKRGVSYFNNSFLGIGKAGADTQLDVNGVTTSLGFQTNQGNTTFNLLSRDSAGNSALYVQHASNNTNQPIAIFSYGATAANGGQQVLKVGKDISYFNNTNVGIGVTDPDQTLDVDGNIRIPNQGKIVFGSAGTTPNDYLQLYDVGAGLGNSLLKLVQDGNTRFSVEGANGNVYMQGNVGIGTNNAGTKLHVRSSVADCVLRLQAADSTTHNSTVSFGDNDSNGIGFIKYAHNGDSMRFATAGVEAVRVDSSQRVGIGTTSVLGVLQVNGRALIEGPTVPSTITVSDSGDATKALRLGYEPTWDVGCISASDFGAGWKDIVIAPHAGKVGVGTSNPDYTLTVDAGTTNEIARFRSSDNDALISIQDNTDAVYIGLDASLDVMSLGFSNSVGASSNLNIDTAGNVGIGTNDPFLKFYVDGNSRVEGNLMVGDAARANTPQTALHVKSSSTNARIRIEDSDSSNQYWDFYVNQGDGLHFNEDTETRVTFKEGGNVGIGTNDPDALLHVYSAGNGEIEVERNGGAKINLQAQASKAVVGTDSNHQLDLKTNGGARMTLLTNGDVGIGTASPLDMLHIVGSVRADLKLEGGFQGSATDVGKFQYAYTPRGGDTNNRNIASISAYNTTTDSTAGGYLSINTRATNSTLQERIRVNQDGQVDIYGNASFASYLYHKGDEDTNIKFNTDDFIINVGGAAFFRATETTQNTIKLNSDSTDADFYLYSSSSTPAIFMRGSDGEVGLNTTNPTASLHVVGNARIKGASSDGVLNVENAAASQTLRIDQNSIRTSTNNNLTFLTNGNSNSLVLNQSTNNVGIGVTDPDAKLEVAGVIKSSSTSRVQADVYNNSANSANIIYRSSSTTIVGNNASAVVIEDAGNVGIGTTDPSVKLDVNGTIKTKVYAIGNLPSASPAGQRAMVNNSYYTFGSSVIGQTVYAGGSAVAPVYSDGSYWRYG